MRIFSAYRITGPANRCFPQCTSAVTLTHCPHRNDPVRLRTEHEHREKRPVLCALAAPDVQVTVHPPVENPPCHGGDGWSSPLGWIGLLGMPTSLSQRLLGARMRLLACSFAASWIDSRCDERSGREPGPPVRNMPRSTRGLLSMTCTASHTDSRGSTADAAAMRRSGLPPSTHNSTRLDGPTLIWRRSRPRSSTTLRRAHQEQEV